MALQISASVLANDATLPVARYLEQLAHERLKYLRDPDGDPDDPQASVAASLALSYAALPAPAQALLAQLSVFVSSCDREALLAVVAGVEDPEAEVGLLHRRSLVEYRNERFALHDLVRAFATICLPATKQYIVQMRHASQFRGRKVLRTGPGVTASPD